MHKLPNPSCLNLIIQQFYAYLTLNSRVPFRVERTPLYKHIELED